MIRQRGVSHDHTSNSRPVGCRVHHGVSGRHDPGRRPRAARQTPARAFAGRFHRLPASRPAAIGQPGRLAPGADPPAHRLVAPDGAADLPGPCQDGTAGQLRPADPGPAHPHPEPDPVRHLLGVLHLGLPRVRAAAGRDLGFFRKQHQEHRRLRSRRLHRRGQPSHGAGLPRPLERTRRRSRRPVQPALVLFAARPAPAQAHPGRHPDARPERPVGQRQHQAGGHGHRGRVHLHVLERRRLQSRH